MIPATAIGNRISVCTIDWENPFGGRVMTKTHASGSEGERAEHLR
jgi:hypothetical protein